MDAESLAQIEHIVTTAVAGTEARLRNDMQAASASLTQGVNGRLNEKFEEAERHSGALFEEALHRIDLVVEGHQALFEKIERVEARMEDGFAKMEHEFLEVRSQIRLSYRQLEERVETLEQRVTLIEKRIGLAN